MAELQWQNGCLVVAMGGQWQAQLAKNYAVGLKITLMRMQGNAVSSSCECLFEQTLALFEDHQFGFLEAMAAIGPLAQLGIDTFGIAIVAPRRLAQVAFADGIADTGIHVQVAMLLAGDPFLMRMDCIIKR
jgi:hypothetical protein